MNRIKENLLYYCDSGFGKQWIYRYNNGYGASIIKGRYACGNKFFPYELMVIKFDENDCSEQVEVPFAPDTKGYLRIEDIKEYLNKIKNIEVEDGI